MTAFKHYYLTPYDLENIKAGHDLQLIDRDGTIVTISKTEAQK